MYGAPRLLSASSVGWTMRCSKPSQRAVRGKNPERDYYVIEIREGLRRPIKGERLYKWHVGEGFDHKEGWWVGISE